MYSKVLVSISVNGNKFCCLSIISNPWNYKSIFWTLSKSLLFKSVKKKSYRSESIYGFQLANRISH